MSVAELKVQIAGLSAKERLQLTAYLAELEDENETEFRAEIGRRMQAMDAGRKVTEQELSKRHKQLLAKGR